MSKHPQTLTADESEKLLTGLQGPPGTLHNRPKTIRNYTMGLLMLDAGLRVGEVVKLVQWDLWFNHQPATSLLVPAAITKTKTGRIVPLTGRLRAAITTLEDHIWQTHNAMPGVFAFFSKYPSEHMTTRQVERIIRAAAMAAIGRPVNPHVLRHTFASRLMRITNSRTVQQLLGHKQLSSTQIYTHPNADDLKTAISKMSDNSTPES